ncbi:MAG: hypothetical protein ACR2PI_06695 [Hyphomicrobiaceae bacterium]
MKLIIVLSLAFWFAATPGLAETRPKPMQAALDKIVTEALYCTAYFGFAQEAVRRRPDASAATAKTLIKRLGELADQALNIAVTSGRRAELSAQAFNARQSSVFDDVRKITKNSMANLPVLVGRYDTSCKQLVLKPEVRVQELFRREFD